MNTHITSILPAKKHHTDTSNGKCGYCEEWNEGYNAGSDDCAEAIERAVKEGKLISTEGGSEAGMIYCYTCKRKFIPKDSNSTDGVSDLVSCPSYEDILGAVARGWCDEVNSNKTMDSDLAVSIAKELLALLHRTAPKEYSSGKKYDDTDHEID